MTDPYWDPIFARLYHNLDLLYLMAMDSDDKLLIMIVEKNPPLLRRVSPFMKGTRIIQKNRFSEFLIKEASEDEALRKLIFLDWVVRNQKTLSFTTIPIDERSLERLLSGEFGKPAKIKILSFIDPRESAKPVYSKFEEKSAVPSTASETPQVSLSPAASTTERAAENDEDRRREISSLRDEAKQLRKRIKELETHKVDIERRLSEKSQQVYSLQEELRRSKEEIERLENQIRSKSKDLGKMIEACKYVPKPSPSIKGNEEFLERRVHELENIVERRDSTVERLNRQLEEMRDELRLMRDCTSVNEGLRKTIKELESEIAKLRKGLVARLAVKMCWGRKDQWFAILESVGGEKQILSPKAAALVPAIESEWFVLYPGREEEHPEFRLLEENSRKEFVGAIVKKDSRFFLDCEEGIFPILCTLPEIQEGRVAAGIWLPEFADRPAGIYSFREIVVAEKEKPEDTFISFSGVKKFYGLDKFDVSEFVRFLKTNEIEFCTNNEGLKFTGDFRRILSRIRGKIPIEKVCRKNACRKAAESFPFVRFIKPDEICNVCLEEFEGPSTVGPEPHDFHGARVLIAGGDFVGSNYRKILQPYNLEVDWISGFEGLGGLRSGLGNYDYIVIILKQISHTLLREILISAKSSQIPVVYSKRRGISGILQLLREVIK